MNNEYIIKVTRLKKVFGCAIPFKLYIDDNEIGSLSNGKSFDCIVEKGVHKVILKSTGEDVVQEVTLNKNHKVEITLKAMMGLIAATPNIIDVKYM